jgi:hypothetical protein
MIRPLAVLVALVLLSAAVRTAPVPAEVEKVYFFPTRVGDKRVYQEGKEERSETVTEVSKKEAAFLITIEVSTARKAKYSQTMSVSEDGVYRLTLRKEKYDPPHCFLKLPCKPDDTWDVWPKTDGQRLVCKVGKTEKVTVPAGTFDAIRIEFTRTIGKDIEPDRFTEWHAPSVGLVKMHEEGATNPWLVLKSFTRGKE